MRQREYDYSSPHGSAHRLFHFMQMTYYPFSINRLSIAKSNWLCERRKIIVKLPLLVCVVIRSDKTKMPRNVPSSALQNKVKIYPARQSK